MKVYNFNDDEEDLMELERKNAKKAKPSKTKKGKTKKEVFEEDEDINVAKEIVSMIIYIVFIFLVVFLTIKFVGQRTIVSGSSMETTLSDGDNLIVDKFTYNFIRDPERFDVIIFPYRYEDKTFFIKRVIGLPGETVHIDADGTIYIDGKPLAENYGNETIIHAGLASEDIVLADDEYFVLGDNRNNSSDSRYENVGNIKREDIIGRGWMRIYPFTDMGLVENLR